MTVFLIYAIFPLFWLVISSTKTTSDLFSTFGLWFGHDFALLGNIRQTLSHGNGQYLRWLGNTALYSVTSAVGAACLAFWQAGGNAGTGIGTLPVTPGSAALSQGGNPVLVRLPDGRLLYNAGGSGAVWINPTGASTGPWTEYQTTMPAGYSRNLTYDSATGQVVIIGNEGTSAIVYADTDFGHSAGTYYHVVSKLTGQVIGTSDNTTDANIGNGNVPDVELENAGAASDPDTQYWHVVTKQGGGVTLLNESGGRAAEIWTGNAVVGQEIRHNREHARRPGRPRQLIPRSGGRRRPSGSRS